MIFSQSENILSHLKRAGTITPLEALELYGCFRLAAIIHDLKKEHNIETEMISAPGKGGKMKHFARYRIHIQPQREFYFQ